MYTLLYSLLAALGLHCFVRLSLVAASRVAAHGPLSLWSTGSRLTGSSSWGTQVLPLRLLGSGVVAHDRARGIFLDQRPNTCPLHCHHITTRTSPEMTL